MNTELTPVTFHRDTVYLVEIDGQPFAPARPIVENIGLDWPGQYTKLISNKKRWTVEMISTVAGDGHERELLCIPVRKLPAWLATINVRKVRADLRAKLETYQAESDNVLWDYWTKGRAVNPRSDSGAENSQTVPISKYLALLESQNRFLKRLLPRKRRKRPYRMMTPWERGEILRMKREGVSLHEISRRTGRHRKSLQHLTKHPHLQVVS